MTTTKQVESLTTYDFITSDIIDDMSQEENTQNNTEPVYTCMSDPSDDTICDSCA